MTRRERLRLLRFGLSTVLGLRRRGFFIPYRGAEAVPEDAVRRPYAHFEALFAAAADDFRAMLARLDAHAAALEGFGGAPPAPRWQQDWFPRLDGTVAYMLVRERRPRRIVEIGSGHSTRFLVRALADGAIAAEVTAIDPAPRADIAALPIRHLRMPVQAAGTAPFAALAAGDILFIDSSHVAMPGSDVDFLFARILPGLPAGVLIHVHDVLLPDPYPAAWAWRGYNEQGLVAALLAAGGVCPLFASHYTATRLADAVARSVAGRLPLPTGALETSLWLEKLSPPIGTLDAHTGVSGCDITSGPS